MSGPPTKRETAIADAALSLLGGAGPRGLTHRAVDQQAGLPEGSTSNLFRTRAALLIATNERLAAIDAAELAEVAAELSPRLDRETLAAALARIVERWAGSGAERSAARLELFLEARRQPEFAPELAGARRAFHDVGERLLARLGCERPTEHAAVLMAMVEGMVCNQLLHPASSLSTAQAHDAFGRLLASC